MKFDNLMYNGIFIKAVIDLDEVFIETNEEEDYSEDECDTLDLTNITIDITNSRGDYNG